VISKNVVAAFLIFCAALLSCILIMQHTTAPAQADQNRNRPGFYLATTAAVDSSTDLLWIASNDTNYLLVYDTNRRGLVEMLARADLAEVFGVTVEPRQIRTRIDMPRMIEGAQIRQIERLTEKRRQKTPQKEKPQVSLPVQKAPGPGPQNAP